MRSPSVSAEALADLVASLVAGRREEASAQARAIAWSAREIGARRGMSTLTRARVYVRDGFTCRYCGQRTVLAEVLELLARIYPDELPFVSHNYPAGRTHPAFAELIASVDHLEPRASGGTDEIDNLVTACWPCNIAKSEFSVQFLGWAVLDPEPGDWHGLTEHYPELWHLAREPNPALHRAWMRALEGQRRGE